MLCGSLIFKEPLVLGISKDHNQIKNHLCWVLQKKISESKNWVVRGMLKEPHLRVQNCFCVFLEPLVKGISWFFDFENHQPRVYPTLTHIYSSVFFLWVSSCSIIGDYPQSVALIGNSCPNCRFYFCQTFFYTYLWRFFSNFFPLNGDHKLQDLARFGNSAGLLVEHLEILLFCDYLTEPMVEIWPRKKNKNWTLKFFGL